MNQVRRYVVIIGLALGWLSSPADASSWVIELTNGRAITASRVWEEGDDLKFAMTHGSAGVSKALVKRVTSATKRATSEHDIRQAAGQGSSPQAATEDGVMQSQKSTSQADREQKLALTTQLADARKKYLEAMVARNPSAEQEALENMQAVYKQIYALADAVKAKHEGALPAWWNE
jgi:hypothetical protein